MTIHRLEITLNDELWDALNEARGHEPRASFVKRALEEALVASERRKELEPHLQVQRDYEASKAPVAKVLGSSVRKAPRGVPELRDTWGR